MKWECDVTNLRGKGNMCYSNSMRSEPILVEAQHLTLKEFHLKVPMQQVTSDPWEHLSGISNHIMFHTPNDEHK